jgi:hypothetical protein
MTVSDLLEQPCNKSDNINGTHVTGSARKLAVVSKAYALELGRFSSRNNFHSEVLRRNEIFVLTCLC